MTAPQAPGTARLAAGVFAVLLLATFGAFLIASQLKAEPAELAELERRRYFSPNGDGRRDTAPIRFAVPFDDEAAVDIVDEDGARVRRIAEAVPLRAGEPVRVVWDGRTDAGAVAADGPYRARLVLRDDGRAVLSGKAITLDTEPPDPAAVVDADQPIVAPGEPVAFRVRGTGTRSRTRLQVVRTDVEPERVVRRFTAEPGERALEWDGRDDAGRVVPAGTYLIAVTAGDAAGNTGTGPPLPPVPGRVEGRPGVTVRSLAVRPPVRAVRAGDLAAFRIDARGRSYTWSIRRIGSGRVLSQRRRPKRGTTLLVRAPEGAPSGVHLLEVRSGGDAVQVPFAVQANVPSPGRRPLVVLPMISWVGRSPVDDAEPRDGIPDTFTSGSDVPVPRLFAYDGGLPPGFADGIAPLLVWLDRQGESYDLTTDLALDLGGGRLRAGERRGVILAGPPEWVSRGLGRRLRAYVADGGRVAMFGANGLQAGVTVREGRLVSPTPAGPLDAFGARLDDPRRLPAGAELSVVAEDPDIGLLEGFSGVLDGFQEVEELAEPGQRSRVAVGVGQALTEQEAAEAEREGEIPRAESPALSAVRLGKGLVIRVGLPRWVPRLARGDAAVEQITFNVVDLLRGERPQPRSAG